MPQQHEPSRFVNFRFEGWNAAGDQLDASEDVRRTAGNRAWRQACEAARVVLSNGDRGKRVKTGERWACAIARVAGELMFEERVGRRMGPVSDTWERIVYEVAAFGSAAFDGLVAHESGLRVTARSISG